MDQKSVIVLVVAIIALVAILGFSSSLTGMAVSNVFKIGTNEVKLEVGESQDVLSRLVTLDAVNKGRSREEDNVKIIVNGQPAFIKRDSVQNIKGLMIVLSNIDTFDGTATLLIRPSTKLQTAPDSIRKSLPDLDLANWPYPFISSDGSTHNYLLIVEGDDKDPDDVFAANLVASAFEDITGKMPHIVKRGEQGSEEIKAQGKFNMVYVGQACTNEFIADLLETKECGAGLKSGYGLIQLKSNNDRAILIVTGNSNEDVIRAAKALKEYYKIDNTQFFGDYVFVKGTFEEPEFSKR